MNADSAAIPSPAFEAINSGGHARLLLLCDHAGRLIPSAYGQLGLAARQLDRHIAWDIGAADLTRELAVALDAPALLARYSRLFIDLNRPLGSPASIPAVSDGVIIPANQHVDIVEAERRAELSFWPYHRQVERQIVALEERGGGIAVVMVHTFTPSLDGHQRPWHVGVLSDRDRRVAVPLLDRLRSRGDFVVGDNQPYSGASPLGYGLEAYGQRPGRLHVMIEIRQDLVESGAGARRWAAMLAPILAAALAKAVP